MSINLIYLQMKTITSFRQMQKQLLSVLMYVFIFMFSGLMHAQTLKTDNNVPALSACGDYEEFTLRIGSGATACNATLQIVMPQHILYQVGSAKLGGVPLAETGATEAGASVTLSIPVGTPANELVITYNAKATCEAIETANLPIDQKPAVTYNLNGCGSATLTGESEAINVRFAVLNLTIAPAATQGVIGDEFTRTITLQNSGNGYINEFTLEANIGSDLQLLSTMPTTIGAWTVTQTSPGIYTFSGSTLAPGQTVSFTDQVKMIACGNTNTQYNAYYGCTAKCTLSNVDDTKTAVITYNTGIRPNIGVTLVTSGSNYCFDQDYEVVLRITNSGAGTSTNLQLNVGSHYSTDTYGSTHLVGGYEIADDAAFTTNVNTPTLGTAELIASVNGNRFGTTGLPVKQMVNIPDLEPGQTVYLRYKQRNNLPAITCDQQVYRILYGSVTVHSGSTYQHKNACDSSAPESTYNVTSNYLSFRNNASQNFDGFNAGSLDVDGTGSPYNGKYQFSNFYFEYLGFVAGDYVDVVLEVSPSLAAGLTAGNITFIPSSGTATPAIIPDGSGKFRLRFTYGSSYWPVNTALSLSNSQLLFSSVMDCSVSPDAWYRISVEIDKNTSCPGSVPLEQWCRTYNIATRCTGPCTNGGLGNSYASLKRITEYGSVAQNPDTQGKPQVPLTLVDPNTSTVPVNTDYFVPNDVIEISQVGRSIVTGASPVTEWAAGRFAFNVPNATYGFEVIANSGKMVITRGATTYTVTGLPVTMSGLNVAMDFDMALLHANGLPASFTGFVQDDILVSSVQITPKAAYPNTQGTVAFPTTYHFTHNNTNYACSGGYRAMGVSGRLYTSFYVYDGEAARNITSCAVGPQLFRFDAALNGNAGKNIMFPNEYRQFIFPKKMVLTVPAGLMVNGFLLRIQAQGYSGTVNNTGWLDITPANGTVEIDLEAYIKQIVGDNLAAIDEGVQIDFYPRVQATCEATDLETLDGYVVYDAAIPFRDANKSINYDTGWGAGMETMTRTMSYNTDNTKVSAQMVTPTVPSPNGQAQWVVQVTNGSSFRTFNNAWIGGTAGVNVVSVQQVTSSAGTTTTGAPLTEVGGVYQIGNLPTVSTRYYLVTADITGCNNGSVELAFGHSCNGYPTSVADADCIVSTLNGAYTQVHANLQSSIVSQNAASYRPLLCEALPYTIMISNSGQGTAETLVVSIPLTSAEGLAYVPGTLEITPAYAGVTVPAFISAADTNVTVVGGLFPSINISIPAAIASELKFGERLQVKVQLTSDGCDFRSGQRIGFYPMGLNACGTIVQHTAGVATNRVIIDGAPVTEPTLTINTETAQVNIAENVGDPLTALYNFAFTNQGDGVNNYPVDTTYGLNIKLPANWEFDGNPQDLVDAALLNYIGLDPVKGYVYEFISNLTVGNSVTITDALMNYTGNVAALNCEDDLGIVVASVYNVFTPNRAPGCTGTCDIEQVVLTSEAPISLPVIPAPTTNEAEQGFCITEGATIADLQVNETNVILKWYSSATGSTVLNETDVLTTGTYSVYVSRIDGATGCESQDRLEIEVTVYADVTANAGANQTTVNGTTYTMNGNQPVAPATGTWTVVSSTAPGVVITTPSAYNTAVQLPLGSEAVLKWTVTNGTCSAEDEVTITSTMNTINAEDDNFSSVYVNDEDGNPNVGNVLPNNGNGADMLGANPATTVNVTISVVTPASAVTPGANVPVLDPVTGNVSVPANTPAGTYFITYQICETAILPVENCDTAVVTVVVVPANSTVAVDDFNNTFINTPVSGSVATNDFDPEGHTQSWTPFVDTTGGHTLVLRADGTYTFTPATGFTGTVSYPYTVCDNATPQACDTAVLTIEVLPTTVNANTVTANNDTATTEEGTPVIINVVANDFDLEGDNFSVTTNTNPSNGTVVNNGDGTFTYTPNPGFTGVDTFTYTICDDGTPQACDTATVTITVLDDNGTNNTYANDDAYNGSMNTPITGNVTDNDFDPEGHTQIVTNYTQPAHGTVTVNPDGTFTYTPNTGYTGPDQFVYTICDNGTPQACDTATVYLTVNCVLTLEIAAQNDLVECDANSEAAYNTWLAAHGGATVNAVCSPVTWNAVVDSEVTNCGNTSVRTVTFTATNANGQSVSTTATFTIVDTVAPTFVGTLPVNVTVECDAVPTAAQLTAEDACEGMLPVTYNEVRTAGSCPNSYTLTRTWTVADSCGNTNAHTQVITVQDTTAPTFVGTIPANVTVECNAVPEAVILTATDNCDADVTVAFNETRTNGSCVNSYILTRTWTVADSCGNTNVHTQVVTVQDTTAPAFDQPILPANVTVECDAVPEAVTLTATDNCDADVTVAFNESRANGSCANSYILTRTWTVADSCGNTNVHTQVVTVQDTTAPVFTTAPQHAFTECGTTDAMADYQAWLASYGGSVATDNCGTVTMSYWIEDTNTICGNAGTVIVNFAATDECGNRTVRQAGFAFRDTTAPVINTANKVDLVIQCSINGEDELNAWLSSNGGLTATDACSPNVIWSHDYTGQLAICGGPITVTFTVKDACGNTATETATVEVIDTIVPVLTKQAQGLTVQCGSNTTQALNNWLANHGGAQASDSCSIVTWTNNYDATNFVAACGNTGSVEVTFTGSDACGNVVTTTATFTIEDTAAPVLVTPAQPQTVECSIDNDTALQAWLSNNGGATASDNCDASLTWTNNYGTGENFIAACGNTGEVTVTFTATDACGNSVSTVAKFTIVDTTKPVFDIEPQNAEVECDGAGNTAEYEAWLAAYADAQASDNCGTVTYSYSIVDTVVLCGKTSQKVVRFTATDECGNRVSKQATFTIVDTTAPDFITEPEDVTVECDGAGNMNELNAWLSSNGGGATATDLCSTKVTWSNNYRGLSNDCGGTGSATVTFTATDDCGNSSSRTATFTIVDTTAPEFVSELPAKELFIRCEDLKEPEVLKATDICGSATVTVSDEVVPSDCGDTKYTILRTWTATDACGNETSFTQTIHLSCKIEVFNAVTPNGDGYNDELVLKGIECYPGNTVDIYNRWGVLVYETKDYNSNGNTFKGYANGRVTVSKGSMLPTGTYYYIIKYNYDLGNGQVYPIEQAGYLHLETTK